NADKKPERRHLPGFFVAESSGRRQVLAIMWYGDPAVASRSAKTLEPFTIVVPASVLPKCILDRFPEPLSADARFALTVEPEASEAEKLDRLRRELQTGLDDLAAGRVSDGKHVFARLKARFPSSVPNPSQPCPTVVSAEQVRKG